MTYLNDFIVGLRQSSVDSKPIMDDSFHEKHSLLLKDLGGHRNDCPAPGRRDSIDSIISKYDFVRNDMLHDSRIVLALTTEFNNSPRTPVSYSNIDHAVDKEIDKAAPSSPEIPNTQSSGTSDKGRRGRSHNSLKSLQELVDTPAVKHAVKSPDHSTPANAGPNSAHPAPDNKVIIVRESREWPQDGTFTDRVLNFGIVLMLSAVTYAGQVFR
ncbi:hypothetical protein SVAN01_02160 [Stagonosporopsis vannaccii]|nr:hypothetical protein SVAN01_02160 [Stagonosporopsis vannaccii]